MCIRDSLVMACSSCDEGRIYEEETIVMEEGRVVKMTADITGIDKWAQGYSIVIAGFNETSEYAVTSANIPAPSVDGGTVRVIMSGISDEVKTLEILSLIHISSVAYNEKKMSERDITVGSEGFQLPGTLTVPKFATVAEARKVPCIIPVSYTHLYFPRH